MRLLLDTHIFIWAAGDRKKLDPRILALLLDSDNDVFIGAASVWEIAIKTAQGKLDFPVDKLERSISEMDFAPMPITHAHALLAGALPQLHGDPFDRMLVAQARQEGMTLVTVDKMIAAYDVPIWAIS